MNQSGQGRWKNGLGFARMEEARIEMDQIGAWVGHEFRKKRKEKKEINIILIGGKIIYIIYFNI